ncbi:hypothetical protein FEZ60_31555 [Rhodococcus sp. MS16]|uniref:hypothetical protein n=1 Tax=Rhodococcus sp. MS16 TaxID=2579941 RepID=UPI001561D790|nr:hypothetical protein [Rhodococcus sp. MS16]NRI70046.1 hypothetical protein [Rhodococcus sp. MS16]
MTFNALGVTVMISGPGDTSEEVEVVRNVIRTWNSNHAEDEGVVFVAKHCSTDSVPIYREGQDGQSVINDQITNKSDVIVALFKYRLGTPTPLNEHSGTVEAADLLAPNIPVHFYFWDSESLPAALSREGSPERDQWGRLSAFREKFHENNSGLYATFNSHDHLVRQVESALWADARKFAASRLTSTPAPSVAPPTKPGLTVNLVGEVWRGPAVKKLVDLYIDGDTKREYERVADGPLSLSKTEKLLTEWADGVRKEMHKFDEDVAAAVAAPISAHVTSDALIDGLEIEITFEGVIGLNPTDDSWKKIWTPLRAPKARDTLFPYLDTDIPRIDYRDVGPIRSAWGYDDDDVLILTVELDEARKRSRPVVVEDIAILTLPYDSDAVREVKYAWSATVRNLDAEWSGSGTISVLGEEFTTQRIGAWLKSPGRD